MFSLFAEAKFWTYRNSVQVRLTDFGAFRFSEKKEIQKNDVYLLGKESYAESRGAPTVLGNRRPERLRSRVRELDQVLGTQRVVWCSPRADGLFTLITCTGLVINIKTNLLTNALQALKFDRYFVGKVAEICDVVGTKTHFIFSHVENQLTLVHFAKAFTGASAFEKMNKLDPKMQTVDLVGGSGRRLQRRVSANTAGDTLLTWWQTSSHEVYPWAPNIKDWDRANVHIYNLNGTALDLVSYMKTEYEPICIKFSTNRSNVLWVLEQKVSRKGQVTVESSLYHLVKKQLVRKAITSTPLQTHVSCHAFSPDETRIVLGCIDGSIVVVDESRGVTREVRAAFIPTVVTWHSDGALLVCANDRAQLQFFDLALSCVRSQLLSEDVTPSNLLDLGAYFTSQVALLDMVWGFKESVPFYGSKYVPNDNWLLLVFEGGPLASLSVVGAGGLAGDIHSNGLTPDTLVSMYLTWQQVDRAICLLLSLDWNKEGAQCLSSLYHITNTIFNAPLTPEREMQLQTSLGCFHAPLRSLTSATYDEFSDQVHDLTRRFFHQLVRHKLYEKAFCLALDLNDRDLYLDLLECARRLGDRQMATAIHEQLNALEGGSADSSCSCSTDDEHCLPLPLPPLPTVKKPPLPEISRFGRHRESAFFSRTQSSFSMIPEEPSPPPTSLPPAASPIDQTLPGVIEKLYDLPARPRLLEKPKFTMSSSKNYLPEVHKPSFSLSSLGTLSSTVPYVPMSTTHFSSILGPSSSLTSSPTPATTASSSSYLPFSSSHLPPLSSHSLPPSSHLQSSSSQLLPSSSHLLASTSHVLSSSSHFLSPASQLPPSLSHPLSSTNHLSSLSHLSSTSSHLLPSTSPHIQSSSLGFSSSSSTPPYPANPLSLHLYGAASKATEQKAAAATATTPFKPKVKFSDTVTQIVVPDISELSGEKRRVKGIDPARELADSLPLCLGNKDYLKNFSKPDEDEEMHGATIKVIHFGVV